MDKNKYLTKKATILKIKRVNPSTKLYTIKLDDSLWQKKFVFLPGQFVLVSLPGFGEAPFAICSSPFEKNHFDLCIRNVGTLTGALDSLKEKAKIEIRGPLGNGFPIKEMENKDIVLIAGGTGIAPITSMVEHILKQRDKFQKVYFLYGAKTPKDLLFSDRFRKLQKEIDICLIVQNPDKNWKKERGLVNKLCKKIDVDSKNTICLMCGPSIMYPALYKDLKKLKIAPENIYVSMERRMRCGLGKCQHCSFGKYYVCLNGPIFQYSKIKGMPEWI